MAKLIMSCLVAAILASILYPTTAQATTKYYYGTSSSDCLVYGYIRSYHPFYGYYSLGFGVCRFENENCMNLSDFDGIQYDQGYVFDLYIMRGYGGGDEIKLAASSSWSTCGYVSSYRYDITRTIPPAYYWTDIEIWGEGGSDELFCAADSDGTPYYTGFESCTIKGGDHGDWIYGSSDPNSYYEELEGGDGNDHIYGNNGDDRIEGGNDDDYLVGGLGDDCMFGEHGIDEMYGHFESGYNNTECNLLYGGTGVDAGETENDVCYCNGISIFSNRIGIQSQCEVYDYCDMDTCWC